MDVDHIPAMAVPKPRKTIASFRSLPRKIRRTILAEAVIPDLLSACLHKRFGEILCKGCLKASPGHVHNKIREVRNAMASVCRTLSALDRAQLPSELELDVEWVDTRCNDLLKQCQMKRIRGWSLQVGDAVLDLAEWNWKRQMQGGWVLRRYLVQRTSGKKY